MKSLIKKFIALFLLTIIIYGCNKHYYLKVDECYMYNESKNYGEIYTAFTLLIAQHDLHLIFDKINNPVSFDRNSVNLYVNDEYHSSPNISVFTNQGRNENSIISVDEGFIDMALIFDVTLPSLYGTGNSDSVSVKVEIEKITFCDSAGNCSEEKYEHHFTYYSKNDDEKENASIRRGTTWWRNPNVEVCVGE